MTYIIKSGSLQYIVNKGDLLPVQSLDVTVGDTIDLQVLVAFESGKIFLEEQSLKAKVVKQFRDDKVTVVKYKSKSKYHKKQGHRQEMTLLEIM